MEQLLREHDRRERINLHIVAKLVSEGDVSRSRRIIALLHFGGMTRRACDLLGNLVEEGLQIGRVRSRFVEVGIGRTCAKVPNPSAGLPRPLAILPCVAGRRIVARHSVHELVLTASAAVRRIGRGVRTTEDADGVNGRPRILHRLSSGNGRTRHTTFETVAARRRTIGEEHHDLLGVLATRRLASRKLQSEVSLRRAGRLNGIDGRLQVIRQRPDTRGQVLHHLAVVVGVLAIAIGIVTYLIAFLSRKLHERNLMLLGRVAYVRVLLRDLVDERVRRSLERIDPLRVVAITHGIVH